NLAKPRARMRATTRTPSLGLSAWKPVKNELNSSVKRPKRRSLHSAATPNCYGNWQTILLPEPINDESFVTRVLFFIQSGTWQQRLLTYHQNGRTRRCLMALPPPPICAPYPPRHCAKWPMNCVPTCFMLQAKQVGTLVPALAWL